MLTQKTLGPTLPPRCSTSHGYTGASHSVLPRTSGRPPALPSETLLLNCICYSIPKLTPSCSKPPSTLACFPASVILCVLCVQYEHIRTCARPRPHNVIFLAQKWSCLVPLSAPMTVPGLQSRGLELSWTAGPATGTAYKMDAAPHRSLAHSSSIVLTVLCDAL